MNNQLEYEHGGYHFRIARLSARDQFHLSRRVAPLLPPLAPLILKFFAMGDKPFNAGLLEIAELAEPFAQALAGLKESDADAILDQTLSSVQVLTNPGSNTWMMLWAPGVRMAPVIELNDFGKLLPIAVRVITYNLGTFTDGLLTRHGGKGPEPSGELSPNRKTG